MKLARAGCGHVAAVDNTGQLVLFCAECYSRATAHCKCTHTRWTHTGEWGVCWSTEGGVRCKCELYEEAGHDPMPMRTVDKSGA